MERTDVDPTNSSCHTFSEDQIETITIVKLAMCGSAVLVCAGTILLIIALRQFHTFVHRLVLYLLAVTLFNGVVTGLQGVPVHYKGDRVVVRDGFHGACTALGFGVELAVSQCMLMVSWILCYLFVLVVFKYPAKSKKHEITGLLVTLLLPFFIDWLPFVHNLYGLAGAWCWIRVTDKDCKNDVVEGFVYQVLYFYGPKTLLLFVTFVLFVMVAVFLAHKAYKYHREAKTMIRSPYNQAVKEALPLLFYPIIYNLIIGVMLANRIDYAMSIVHHQKPSYKLFLAHAICDSLRTMFVPLGFLLHPGTLRKLFGRGQPRQPSEDSTTNYPVPPESFTDVDPLIIRGRSGVNGTARYKSVFESETSSNS